VYARLNRATRYEATTIIAAESDVSRLVEPGPLGQRTGIRVTTGKYLHTLPIADEAALAALRRTRGRSG